LQIALQLSGSVKYSPLGLEERLDFLHIFGTVTEVILPCNQAFKKGYIIPFLRKDVADQVAGGGDHFFLRITVEVVFVNEFFVVSEFRLKCVFHEVDKTVLVFRDSHLTEPVAQKGNALTHQFLARCNSAAHVSLFYLGLFAQVADKVFVVLTHYSAAIADFDLLRNNKSCDNSGDVHLAPTIRYCLITSLHVAHRNGNVAYIAFLQPLAYLI